MMDAPRTATARQVLSGYRDGTVTLEALISWAEELEASAPADPWLRRTAQSLADPLLCRERAMAFVRDLCHIIDQVICYIGYLFPLWDAKRQTLADKIMTTVCLPIEEGAAA